MNLPRRHVHLPPVGTAPPTANPPVSVIPVVTIARAVDEMTAPCHFLFNPYGGLNFAIVRIQEATGRGVRPPYATSNWASPFKNVAM
jgi:hypothetical protein